MSIYDSVIPIARSLAGLRVVLSKAARQRLKWFDPSGIARFRIH